MSVSVLSWKLDRRGPALVVAGQGLCAWLQRPRWIEERPDRCRSACTANHYWGACVKTELALLMRYEKPLLSREQVAELMGVTRETMSNMLSAESVPIPMFKVGPRWSVTYQTWPTTSTRSVLRRPSERPISP